MTAATDLQTQPKLLAIDTSTLLAAAVVLDGRSGIFEARPDPALKHGRGLVPSIQSLLQAAKMTTADLVGFVVGVGPGSYTGLRIGLTVAKTLAFVESQPLATFDSLELIAQNAPKSARTVSVIADAQRGDVYSATFQRISGDSPLTLTDPTSIQPIELWASLLTPGTFVLGPAALSPKLNGAIPKSVVLPDQAEDHWPNGRILAEFAVEVWRRGTIADPWSLEPAYLRRSAAEEQWERRKGTSTAILSNAESVSD